MRACPETDASEFIGLSFHRCGHLLKLSYGWVRVGGGATLRGIQGRTLSCHDYENVWGGTQTGRSEPVFHHPLQQKMALAHQRQMNNNVQKNRHMTCTVNQTWTIRPKTNWKHRDICFTLTPVPWFSPKLEALMLLSWKLYLFLCLCMQLRK